VLAHLPTRPLHLDADIRSPNYRNDVRGSHARRRDVAARGLFVNAGRVVLITKNAS
jgi:hypothetical protein